MLHFKHLAKSDSTVTLAGNSYNVSIIMEKGKPGSYLAAFLTGLETAEPSGLPMQATSQFLVHVLDFLQEQAMTPKACLAIMTDLVEKLPDEGVEALQQVLQHFRRFVHM